MDKNWLLFFVALFTFLLLSRLAKLATLAFRAWVRAKYTNSRTSAPRAD